MLITVSFDGGDSSVVEVDAACRSVAALLGTLAAALPAVDTEKVCLEIGGCAADDDLVCSLEEGGVVTVSATPAARAAHATAALRAEGRVVHWQGFCAAAEEGNARVCQMYLDVQRFFTFDHESHFYDTPLHRACLRRHFDVCRLLVDGSPWLNSRGAWHCTPLHSALEASDTDELCSFLIERGGDLSVQDSSGNSLLHIAVRADSAAKCKLLIDRGCPLNLQDEWGSTPLHVAACNHCHAGVCKLLVDAGAATGIKNRSGQTAAAVASLGGCTAIQKLLSVQGVF